MAKAKSTKSGGDTSAAAAAPTPPAEPKSDATAPKGDASAASTSDASRSAAPPKAASPPSPPKADASRPPAGATAPPRRVVVAPGQSVTTVERGLLGPGAEVTGEDFRGGEQRLEQLLRSGILKR